MYDSRLQMLEASLGNQPEQHEVVGFIMTVKVQLLRGVYMLVHQLLALFHLLNLHHLLTVLMSFRHRPVLARYMYPVLYTSAVQSSILKSFLLTCQFSGVASGV